MRFRWPGLLLAILALVSQLALGAVAVPDDALALDAVLVLCAGDVPAPAVPDHHRPADVSLCPIGITLALPAIVPVPVPVFSPPRPVLVFRGAERPPGRGPPAATARVGTPRGPPFIV